MAQGHKRPSKHLFPNCNNPGCVLSSMRWQDELERVGNVVCRSCGVLGEGRNQRRVRKALNVFSMATLAICHVYTVSGVNQNDTWCVYSADNLILSSKHPNPNKPFCVGRMGWLKKRYYTVLHGTQRTIVWQWVARPTGTNMFTTG